MVKASSPVADMAHVKLQLTGSSLARNTGSPREFEGLKGQEGLKDRVFHCNIYSHAS